MVKKIFLFVFLFFLLDLGLGKFLEEGLNLYYGLGTEAEIALVGHSHLMLGVNKGKLEEETGIMVSKYTREGVNVADRDLMIDQLLEKNPKTKVVLYGVDAWMFTGEGLSSNSYKLFYPFMDDQEVRSYIKEEAEWPDYLQHWLIKTTRYNEGLINSSLRGYLGNWSNYKLGMVDIDQLEENVEGGSFRKINSEAANKAIFEETLNLLMQRNIRVVLVYVPTISFYNRAEPDKFNAERAYFEKLSAAHEQIAYLEYLEEWENSYTFFFDPIHLNPEGQQAFTTAFSKDLKQLLK